MSSWLIGLQGQGQVGSKSVQGRLKCQVRVTTTEIIKVSLRSHGQGQVVMHDGTHCCSFHRLLDPVSGKSVLTVAYRVRQKVTLFWYF